MSKIVKRQIFSYDTKEIPFRQLFESLSNGESLESSLNKNKKGYLIEEGYKIVRGEKFSKYYKKLLHFIRDKYKFDFYYQFLPSLRFQQPGDKENPFHIDCWVGHGPDIINFWLPIVNLNEHNTLQLVDESNTKNLLKQFKEENWPLEKFDKLCKEHAKPVMAKYGEVQTFSNATLHGQIANISKETRLSFDFRLIPKGTSPGNRKIGSFYQSLDDEDLKGELKPAVSVVFSVNQVEHVSNKAQREIIDNYCERNKLEIIRENGEWYGFGSYPQLSDHLSRNHYPVVLFSVHCLPSGKTERKKLLEKLRSYSKGIHFALENKNIKSISDSQIENYFN